MFGLRLRCTHCRLIRFPGNSEAHSKYFFQSIDAELFTGHNDVANQVFPAHALVLPIPFYLNTSK
jgi:hypothetical protein